MSRVVASFEHLWRKYGDPARIRVGLDAYNEYCRYVQAANDRICSAEYDGFYYRFRDVAVLYDQSLLPHEIAWDVKPKVSGYEIWRRTHNVDGTVRPISMTAADIEAVNAHKRSQKMIDRFNEFCESTDSKWNIKP